MTSVSPLEQDRTWEHTANYCNDEPKDIFKLLSTIAEWASHLFDSLECKTYGSWMKNAEGAFTIPNLVSNSNRLRKDGVNFFEQLQDWWEGREGVGFSDVLWEGGRQFSRSVAKVGSDFCGLLKFGAKNDVVSLDATAPGVAKNVFGVFMDVNSLYDNVMKCSNEKDFPSNQSGIERQIEQNNRYTTRWEIAKNSFSIVANVLSLTGVITGIALNSLLLLSVSSVIMVASIAIYFIRAETNDLRNPPSLSLRNIQPH